MIPDQPTFTLADAAARTGIPVDVLRRLWRALGFAIPAEDEAAFDTQDLAALELLHREGRLDVVTEVRLARALGQTTARLADWQASTLSSVGVADVLDESAEQVLVYAWRRHLGEAIARGAGLVEDDLHMVTKTVGFADIVAFSALSNQLDDDRIGDLVEVFETRAGDVVSGLGGRVIKTLGDSVLFVSDDATVGMDIAHGIIDVIGDDSRLPDVRLGLATGSVILRFGDVLGPPVNLAARLTTIARRNRVITDLTTARLLPEARYETRTLTARPVRGFGVLEPIAVRRL